MLNTSPWSFRRFLPSANSEQLADAMERRAHALLRLHEPLASLQDLEYLKETLSTADVPTHLRWVSS